jgi:hypothetical protein
MAETPPNGMEEIPVEILPEPDEIEEGYIDSDDTYAESEDDGDGDDESEGDRGAE